MSGSSKIIPVDPVMPGIAPTIMPPTQPIIIIKNVCGSKQAASAVIAS